MSNTPIDPRENADTAAEILADSEPRAADDPGDTMRTVTAPAENGHPVTSTTFRLDGKAYFAHYAASGGSFAYEGSLTLPASGGNWRGTIRATFAPRDRREAENPQGRHAIQPAIMEAVFYGDFHEAHAMMVAAIAAVSRRRERRAEKSRLRRAAKSAQNAPAPVDAANTPSNASEPF